ncbi:hypothetical protein [Prevotella aurantiaca]|uniref:hypothetical protein n=1 Tax=Prevotella aurantiaca TaxID=596085 RepID=UPI001CAB96BC|nr:hypothetical protein [Prevotella aurantiaca]MBF1386426.1 hypothetical protein [Prevotella aurantiaca]
MPTQKNYNKYKDSILKDIHQGKDIDLLSKEYSIPTPLVKEWETQDKNFNDFDASFSELSSKSRDRISFFEKSKKYFSVSYFKRTLPYIVFFAVIAMGVILAFLTMSKICDVANEKEEVSLKLDTILESHKRIGMSIINSEEKKLLLLKNAIHILKKKSSERQPVEVRKVYHKQVYQINNLNLQNDSI